MLTAQQMAGLVRNSRYHIVSSSEYSKDPFNLLTDTPQTAADIGWFSEIDAGAALWGIGCSPGAVVAVHDRVSSAHCVQVNAREGEDVVVNDKLPASASCEVGQAVGGWYNLRGESQVYRTSVNSGGPSEDEASRFKLTCRYVPGLSRLCETKDGKCEQDEVVSGLEYENASYIRYRCCKMPRTIGQIFADDRLEDVKVWEGYYCPESLDLTGRPRYTLDRYFGPDQLFAQPTSDDETTNTTNTTNSTLLQMSLLESQGALQTDPNEYHEYHHHHHDHDYHDYHSKNPSGACAKNCQTSDGGIVEFGALQYRQVLRRRRKLHCAGGSRSGLPRRSHHVPMACFKRR